VLDWIANGVAFGRKVNVAKLNAGGVGCQLPGVSGSTYVGSGTIVAGQPSFCRHSSTALATACPIAIPCFSRPAGRFANCEFRSVSKSVWCVGKSAVNTSWAAWAAAASVDAPRDARMSNRKGVYARSIAFTASNIAMCNIAAGCDAAGPPGNPTEKSA
jgi:hypothetical protein